LEGFPPDEDGYAAGKQEERTPARHSAFSRRRCRLAADWPRPGRDRQSRARICKSANSVVLFGKFVSTALVWVTLRVTEVFQNRSASATDAPSPRSMAAEPVKQLRAARTNDPLARLERYTARGRRIADLVRAYLAALGHPAEIERQAAVIAAAELQVLAEEARTAALRQGLAADLDQVVRVQGAADRALRRLGIKAGAAVAAPPTPAEYLARRAAERAGKPSGDPA
jgi:hypothetical protein